MTFQILCLSGGGYLGLYTASVLESIEAQTGRSILDSFDLVAGTSVGGIIALGLSAGRSASAIKQAFLDEGDRVFSDRRPPSGILSSAYHLLERTFRPGYDATRLRAIVERVVGPESRMSDLRRPTIIPAINLTKGGPKVFKTGHHARFKNDWRLKVVDVAMATSAAPTYFPIHEIGGEMFADGALVANSPDLMAVHEAESVLNVDRRDMRVLSIGTTTSTFAFSSAAGTKLGMGVDEKGTPDESHDRLAAGIDQRHDEAHAAGWLPADRSRSAAGTTGRAGVGLRKRLCEARSAGLSR